MNIPYIDNSFMDGHTEFADLIALLESGFSENKMHIPKRHHHDYKNPLEDTDSTLLLMPAFDPGKDLGVKIVSVNPNNNSYDQPTIQGIYLYLDGHIGRPKALLDARALTAKRTAAASALAAKKLARDESNKLLIIGTGVLAPELIRAHSAIRPIKQVFVWGRNFEKAQKICREFEKATVEVLPIEDYLSVIGTVDIISCATLSSTPLVFGKDLSPGQHVDLVGAYKPDMREADDEVIRRATIYLDTFQSGLHESGDICIPIKNGLIKEKDIAGDFYDLCKTGEMARKHEDEITLFKSVGHASEDLVGARYYYERFKDSNDQNPS